MAEDIPSSIGRRSMNEHENTSFEGPILHCHPLLNWRVLDVFFYLDLPQKKLSYWIYWMSWGLGFHISCHGATAPSALPNQDKCSPTADQTAPVTWWVWNPRIPNWRKQNTKPTKTQWALGPTKLKSISNLIKLPSFLIVLVEGQWIPWRVCK